MSPFKRGILLWRSVVSHFADFLQNMSSIVLHDQTFNWNVVHSDLSLGFFRLWLLLLLLLNDLSWVSNLDYSRVGWGFKNLLVWTRLLLRHYFTLRIGRRVTIADCGSDSTWLGCIWAGEWHLHSLVSLKVGKTWKPSSTDFAEQGYSTFQAKFEIGLH